MIVSKNTINNLEIITAENDFLLCKIVPAMGGKIISLFNKVLGKEFLWHNANLTLQKLEAGADYDSNFFGGIDELIPNDISENINGIDYPDHGELWTTPLSYKINDNKIVVYGTLPLSELYYEKIITADENLPVIHLDYTIINQSKTVKNFLWKLHAALAIGEGDQLITDAKNGKVVDAEYSRFTNTKEFTWPNIESINASLVPAKNDTMDFFYLYNNDKPEIKMEYKNDVSLFVYSYDKAIFPYQWYFASYGKFLDHYTAILEPCTSMPMSVNEAKALQQCSTLQPQQKLTTRVSIYAGEKSNYGK